MKKNRIKIGIYTCISIIVAVMIVREILDFKYYTHEVTYASTYGDTLAIIPICSKDGICEAFFRVGDDYHMSTMIDTGMNIDYLCLSPNDFQYMEKNHLLSDQWGFTPFSFFYSAISPYGWKNPRKYMVGKLPITKENIHVEYKDNKFMISSYGRGTYMNELRGIPIVQGGDESIMGIHLFLDKIVEFSKKDGELRLHKIVPDNYKKSVELKRDTQRFFDFKPDKNKIISYSRYALPVTVNGHVYSFFIDTGHGGSSIRLPRSEAQYASHELKEFSVKSISGKDSIVAQFLLDKEGTVVIRGKAYRHDVHYTDDYPTKYTINPFGFFDEDFILDFKNNKIWFKE